MAKASGAVQERVRALDPRIRQMQDLVLRWYAVEGRHFPWRRPTASRYEQIVAEVLLQRTRAEVVARFLPAFLLAYPSWKAIVQARPAALRGWLQPLGLWQRRTRALHQLAKAVRARNGRLPRRREDIEALPAVGQYIANAVELFYWDKAAPLLDVNMARVLERCFGPRVLADIRYDPWLQAVAQRFAAHREAAKVNWAILDLAAKVCILKRPRCEQCPLRTLCDVGRRVVIARQGRKSD